MLRDRLINGLLAGAMAVIGGLVYVRLTGNEGSAGYVMVVFFFMAFFSLAGGSRIQAGRGGKD